MEMEKIIRAKAVGHCHQILTEFLGKDLLTRKQRTLLTAWVPKCILYVITVIKAYYNSMEIFFF